MSTVEKRTQCDPSMIDMGFGCIKKNVAVIFAIGLLIGIIFLILYISVH